MTTLIELSVRSSAADRGGGDDERLAERDDHEEAMPFAEVRGPDVPVVAVTTGAAPRREQVGAGSRPSQSQFRAGGSTNAPASTSVSPMSDNSAQSPPILRSIVAARSRSMRTWSPRPSRRTTRYGTTNQSGSSAEARGHRRRHDERGAGGHERHDADEVVGRVRRVERPRELGPRPPDQPEQQDRTADARPR